MKWIGFLVAVLAAWFLRAEWHDAAKGKFAVIGIAIGVFLVLEGYKRDIIEAIRRPKPIDNSDLGAIRAAIAKSETMLRN